ncbi:MAG TPA: formate C-acetyltransferase/glycerol dehydratase family glycyl radical enzyme, partial [Clostridiales bacterium]|nr:formate C-acetyltransferase/glycerol dehydratase family glycyl radical enzyme [Clostridiales bacterium]
MSLRVQKLKQAMFAEERFASIEQAKIVTDVYRAHDGLPRNILRALALKEALARIEIKITEGERIVGNRTTGVRAGVIFPESGLSWVDREIESLPTRPQDPFHIRQEDIKAFHEEIFPFWKGKTLEDILDERIGDEMRAIGKVAKINQTDHAQGHICPNTERWLKYGPAGLIAEAKAAREQHPEKAGFYDGLILSLEGACLFMRRYAALAREMAQTSPRKEELLEVARVCDALSERAPESFREAVQASWFLYVILQMESNASSFSPGRMDQYLYPYYEKDIASGTLTQEDALELIECLFLKFNQIVYLRSSASAKYFAGFPIGFNVAIGGQDEAGKSAENELTYLFLRAQEHLLLP